MELLKKNNAYSLIITEEDRKEPALFKEEPYVEKKSKRKQNTSKQDYDDDETLSKKVKVEEEYLDLYEQEKEAFEERLHNKDDKNTKKVTEWNKKAAEEAARRLAKEQEELMPTMKGPTYRRLCWGYDLGMRKLKQLEMEIQDNEYLFAGKKLTKKEQEDHEHKKHLLRLAQKNARLLLQDDSYQLPQDDFNEGRKIDSHRQQRDLLRARYLLLFLFIFIVIINGLFL